MLGPRCDMRITLLGRSYMLRPTFEGIAETEQRACIGISGLAVRLSLGTAGLVDVASIIYGGMIGYYGKPPLTFEELGDAIIEHGFDKIMIQCGDFIVGASTGQPPKKEKKDEYIPKKKVKKEQKDFGMTA
jgi:hypothetical protein